MNFKNRCFSITPLLWGVMLVLLLFSPAAAQTAPETEILWDSWGVPHVFAPDNAAMFYAFGWAQAQNHADLILKLYGESRGRAAEYWGDLEGDDFSEGTLSLDRKIRTLGIPQQGIDGYNALPDEYRSYVDAFAQGINDYAAAHADRVADEVEVVLPVTGADIVAHGVRVLRYEFVSRSGVNLARRLAQSAPEQESAAPEAESMGSNAWAVAPSRSASGNAMLVANPHQPWFGFGLWVEAHLNSPDYSFYGAALVGTPVLQIGFNDYLGWTHTVNAHDGWDVYELVLQDGGYVLDGEVLPFDTHEEIIRIKQEDGTFTGEVLTVRESQHGRILSMDDEHAYALRVVDEGGGFGAAVQWWEMGHATNFAEFEAALKPLRIPMFTVMYADRDGNIFHLFNEQIPVRETGDWAFWNNTTPAENDNPAIIDGTRSDLIWEYVYHPYEDLPKVLNPDTGWLQNANEPPWTTTYPYVIEKANYPAYFAADAMVWPRPVQSMRLLYEDESITYEELKALKHSTYAEFADMVLDDLISAAEDAIDPSDASDDLLRRSVEVLREWDRHADNGSAGGALFTLWGLTYAMPQGMGVFEVAWDADDPFNTPRGLSDPEGAVQGLREVAQQLELLRLIGGGIDVPYGDVFRMRVGEYDVAGNGSYDFMGTFRNMSFVPDRDLRFRAMWGDSFIAVVEFLPDAPPRAEVLLGYGNATQPDSPHFGDQLTLYTQKALRPAWRTREDIEANLEAREVLTYAE